MGTKRTAWHFFFAILLRTHGPRWLEVRDEVPLGEERSRLDYLLLRKEPASTSTADDPGQTLRKLWPLLAQVTIVELKTIGRPYETGNLDRLWSYVHAYHAAGRARIAARDELRAVLIVPARSPSLNADVDAMRLRWEDLGAGYWQVTGGLLGLLVVEIDVVAERDDDDLLRLFGHEEEHTLEARRFWAEQVGTKEAGMSVQDLEGYDEVMQKILEHLPPRARLAGLTPEQRLAGLDPEQALLAMPDAVLRGFSASYLATLSEATQAAIRQRLGA